MALGNAQYDTIMRDYYRQQLRDKREQKERIQKAYEAIPELAQIDGKIASLSVSKARRLLEGDSGALSSLKEEIAAFSARRIQLLKEHQFPEDYLEMHYRCPHCQDTGYIGNEKCRCFKQAVIDLLYTQSNIREVLEVENFSNFSYSYYSDQIKNPATGLSALATIKKTVADCLKFLERFDSEFENLFFYGDTGVGKTFLSHCIARELLETTHSVIYFSAFELFDLFSKTTFSRGTEEDALRQMHSYIFDCDLLIIDDLGTELTNAFVASQLFLCINERLLRKRSTIISTNLPIEIFRDTYSERVFSRITSNYQMYKLIGDDIRIQKKLAGRKP